MKRPHVLCPRTIPALVLGAALAATAPGGARGQELSATGRPERVVIPDTLHLGELQDAAVRTDPRALELDLRAAQSELRMRNLAAERLPALVGEGQAQYQSDVIRLPVQLPGGARVPSPPNDTYDAHVGARQSIFDPTLAPRRAVERSRLAESQAEVHSALFQLRGEVSENFFTASMLQARSREIAAAIGGLEARLAEARIRVNEGAALPSDTATIAAALLRRGQDAAEARADQGAALARLADITGEPIAHDDVLSIPHLGAAAARAREALEQPAGFRERPEFEQFAAAKEVLAQQARVETAAEKPSLSAFARAGYGRPGLNMLGEGFDGYWVAGVQVKWAPWSWGATGRDREVLELQQRIVATSEASFASRIRRAVQGDIATIDRLEGTIDIDERIVALRERVERETGVRLREGVATGAEYVDRNTELLTARITRAAHQVELARAQAHLLTTLGVEVR